MRKLNLTLLVSFTSLISWAQLVLQDPVSSKVFNSQKYSNVKGSPFLYDRWIKGTVTTSRGVYKGIDLKLDIYSNTLFFNKNDEPYELVDNVREFILMPVLSDSSTYQYYKKGMTAPGLTSEQYVRVLIEKKTKLYRSDIIMVSEMSEINVGMIKTFSVSIRYFLGKENDLKLIKPTKKEVINALGDKELEIKKFIDANELSMKKEVDFVSVLEYYNSLKFAEASR